MTDRDGGSELCGCKVGRMIAAYELTGLDAQMVEWWTAEESKRSLRELAEHFNRELVDEAMKRSGFTPLEGEVANVYRLLTDDDVSRGMRRQARKRLERQGVDVEELTGDFVSYQSIYRHLNECLDADYPDDEMTDEDRRKKGKRRIFTLQNRTETVTQDALSQLRNNGALALDEFDVLVDISVTCGSCARQYTIDELVANEGCRCLRE